ncbi:MAG: nucleotidyl transferase AbiEii/AbiGii toxin family protein [Patescibacteria group bacterium]|nr:nucleotidyl transferase AbiEii/AbiGii toxin family protein [Patescibacteria group bacterium]
MNQGALEREILQLRLLSEIFSRTVHGELALKGGMALRALYGSRRATKDIDLGQDAKQPLAHLQHLMRGAISAATKGVLQDVVVSEPKQTDTVARWKIHGQTRLGTHVGLTVEVSRRGIPASHLVDKPLVRVAADGRLEQSVAVRVYDPAAMAATKLFALQNINRQAARDLYDLDLLVRMDVAPSADLLVGITDRASFVRDAWDKLDCFTWEQFSTEVLPTLESERAAQLDEEEFEAMRLRVGEAIERWVLTVPPPGLVEEEGSSDASCEPACAPGCA